jgi:hypothetical protein
MADGSLLAGGSTECKEPAVLAEVAAGSVAFSLCTTIDPLYHRWSTVCPSHREISLFIIGDPAHMALSVSDATVLRPNPGLARTTHAK